MLARIRTSLLTVMMALIALIPEASRAMNVPTSMIGTFETAQTPCCPLNEMPWEMCNEIGRGVCEDGYTCQEKMCQYMGECDGGCLTCEVSFSVCDCPTGGQRTRSDCDEDTCYEYPDCTPGDLVCLDARVSRPGRSRVRGKSSGATPKTR